MSYGGGQAGQVVILVTVSLVVLIGFVSLAVDVGGLVRARQDVQRAMDAAALAGVQFLPDGKSQPNPGDREQAEALVRDYARSNGYDPADLAHPAALLAISYRCLVGDRDGNGQPDVEDIAEVCPQLVSETLPPTPTVPFQCDRGRCFGACVFNPPDSMCNTLVVDGSKTVPISLASVFGVSNLLSTGPIRGSACRGLCGAPPTVDMDVVVIIDRSRSMARGLSPPGLQKAKIAAKSALTRLDPEYQHVALGVLPQCDSCDPNGAPDTCEAVPNNQLQNPDSGDWILMHLSPDYQELENAIDCLAPAHDFFGVVKQTNLEEPLIRARQELDSGRSDVKKGIIVLTDGAADLSSGDSPCNDAVIKATDAKEIDGITIVIIGFNMGGRVCNRELEGSPYDDEQATKFLADMASPDEAGNPADDNGCTAAENTDGDNFFCEPESNDLKDAFRLAVAALLNTRTGPRLVYVPLP